MTDAEKPEADAQEQRQPEPEAPSREAAHDAPEADAMEQGNLNAPGTKDDDEGLPDEPKGESLEDRLDEATRERSGDEPA